MLAFYEGMSTGDGEKFDRIVSTHPATMICGTAPGEIVRERDQLRVGFETEAVTSLAKVHAEGMQKWADCVAAAHGDVMQRAAYEKPPPPGLAKRLP
jgi:hypothetical protein